MSDPVRKGSNILGIRLPNVARDAANEAAKADDLPLSTYLKRVIVRHLRDGGWLKRERE